VQCRTCQGNAFLVYHKRTHEEQRAFSCAQCGKAFYNRTNLLMHARTHSELRPYPCSVCFKAFKCKGALDRHFRVTNLLYYSFI
jgi:KRAB domain-containing zinc finger protein